MIREGDKFTFDSLSDLALWIESTDRLDGAGRTSVVPRGVDWDLGVGFDGTIAIAKQGGYWPKGAEMVRNGVAKAAELNKSSQAPTIENAVAGFIPDVPAYLAGVPDNMLSMVTSNMVAVSPIVSIGVPNASGDVDAQSIMNRGIAIVTLVDALESQGFRVEVHTALGCANGIGRYAVALCDATVIIKQANEPWNPNSMAFGMGHPALIRRLGFAVRERCEGSLEVTAIGSYGVGALIGDGRFTVAVPWLTDDCTLIQALASIETLAKVSGLDVTLLDK